MATLTAGKHLIPLPGVDEHHVADPRSEISSHQFRNITVSPKEAAREIAAWIRRHELTLIDVFPRGGERLPGDIPPSWEEHVNGGWIAVVELPDAQLTFSVSDMDIPGDPRLIVNVVFNAPPSAT